jgi:hypothetical protein
LKIKRIELGLRTIQRRLAYIDLLNEPLDWLLQGSEELLYLERQALLDLELLGFASGIDMNRHERHLEAAIEKYRPKAEKLTIDSKNADLAPFDQLWQPIVALKKLRAAQKLLAESKEQAIWDEICSGNYDRLNEVERLSPQAANCVSKIPGSDLFLNNLTDISAEAARHLFQWRGNWICLNGCKTLSSEVAAYLFSWEGNWISLNGLTTFSEEIGEKLLNWKGLQLELMGLQVKANGSDQSGLKYLAQWEKSGGKLYVPHEIRQKLDQLL